jgi:hypothetical protein
VAAVAGAIAVSILPLPCCNRCHSNRLELSFRMVPLSLRHCHSLCHCRLVCCCELVDFCFFVFGGVAAVFGAIAVSILPLPCCNRCHWNGWELSFRMVPLPPRHCHSLCHCRLVCCCALVDFLFYVFGGVAAVRGAIAVSILPLPCCNWCHSNRLELSFRMVPLPPRHCHSLCHCRLVCCCALVDFLFYVFGGAAAVYGAIAVSILPLPCCNRRHSNRWELSFRMVPLSLRHCHSLCHCRLVCYFLRKKTFGFQFLPCVFF